MGDSATTSGTGGATGSETAAAGGSETGAATNAATASAAWAAIDSAAGGVTVSAMGSLAGETMGCAAGGSAKWPWAMKVIPAAGFSTGFPAPSVAAASWTMGGTASTTGLDVSADTGLGASITAADSETGPSSLADAGGAGEVAPASPNAGNLDSTSRFRRSQCLRKIDVDRAGLFLPFLVRSHRFEQAQEECRLPEAASAIPQARRGPETGVAIFRCSILRKIGSIFLIFNRFRLYRFRRI